MSAVPLMKLHNSNRGPGDARDSDQMSDEEDDPLESVLARMKYRPQHYRSQEFYSCLMVAGVVCFIIGFVTSYVTFITMDRMKKPYHDANMRVATAILNSIKPENVESYMRIVPSLKIFGFILGRYAWDREQMLRTHSHKDTSFPVAIDGVAYIIQESHNINIQQYLKELNKPSQGNVSKNEYQAQLLWKHFKDLGFDSLSLKSSMVLMSYFDKARPNKVSIIDSRKTEVESYNNNESAYFSTPDGLPVSNVVQGSVVYINFGQDSDFRYLKKMNIDIKGCVVLARLGRVSPVDLVDNALNRGAIGVVLYADPQQYPTPASHTNPLLWPSQLGLLQYHHGDPSTLKTRGIVNGEDRTKVPCVPVQIISASAAEKILLQMSSNNQSHISWMGNLKTTTYPMGPGFSTQDFQLKLEVNAVNVEKDFYNVIGAFQGYAEPDRYILLGSDREPLAAYKTEPLDGTANMMELARVLSKLRSSHHWIPRRTIVFCSWGVTQTEGYFRDAPLNDDWAYLLDSRAVSYINIDVAKQGNNSLIAHAAPLLSRILYEASALVPAPSFNGERTTVYDRWLQESSPSQYPFVGAVSPEHDVQTLLHNQGVPSLHFQFGWNENNPENKLPESKLKYQKAAVQLWGILAWILADRLVLPFDVQQYAEFLTQSFAAIETKYDKLVINHTLPMSQLQESIMNFSKVAEAFQGRLENIDKSKILQVRIMNDQLLHLERAFLHHSRSKPRHIVLAPGSSISDNASVGFGTLQDQLGDISTSPIAVDLRASTSEHIMSVVHCVKSATSVLEEPLVPLTLNDL